MHPQTDSDRLIVLALLEIGTILVAVLVGVGVQRLIFALLGRWTLEHDNAFLKAFVKRTSRPAAYILPLVGLLAILPTVTIPVENKSAIQHAVGILTIVAIAWAFVAILRLWSDFISAHHRIDVEDNLLARQLGTRVTILTRVGISVVSIVAFGSILMTFPAIRLLGTTLLASAGVAGLVIGIAARPLFENLIAGLQLAFTQPIRLDDVVIVEKQYGRIEAIRSTYVVVRTWDLRRLVVPLTYFIQTPFENWTYLTSSLIGEVHIIADFTLDVDALRAEIPTIVERSPLWDKVVQNCQVVEMTDRGMDIRILVSARNSSELFDLRCFVREGAIAYVRDRQPLGFPRHRFDPQSSLDSARSV